MITPQTITRTSRRSLAISISDKGNLIVKAPRNMSLDEIFKFISQKESWIEDRQSKIKAVLNKNHALINYENMLFLGKEYNICMIKGIDSPYLTKDALAIRQTASLLSKKRQIYRWFLSNCDSVLVPRIADFSKKLHVAQGEIKIINSKAKWGMCDNNNTLYFNWKLLMLSPELIDYVIIHELCHLKELNHSKKFWNIVASMIPNYKKCREQLKNTNFLIKLF